MKHAEQRINVDFSITPILQCAQYVTEVHVQTGVMRKAAT